MNYPFNSVKTRRMRMSNHLRKLYILIALLLCVNLLVPNSTQVQAENFSEIIHNNNWILPAEGIITDTFGARGGTHKGIDIAGKFKSKIRAVSSGVVTKSYHSASYGNVVFIKHDDENIETVYAHLHKRLVEKGDHVKKGDQIGQMGNTGRSSGVHLHFEIHKNEWTYNKYNAINPALAFAGISLGNELVYEKENNITVTAEALPENEKIKLDLLESNLQYLHENEEINRDDVTMDLISDETDVTHKVTKGDTIWGIAEKYNVPANKIIKYNNLVSDLIYPNQTLIVKKRKQATRLENDLLVKKMKQVLDERRTIKIFEK